METVTVSPKFQITIPKRVRERLGIKPGQKMQMVVDNGRIQLIPILPIENALGFLEGIGSDIEREPDR
jgi:AbrB family looped-hinge helix DNA binding protein